MLENAGTRLCFLKGSRAFQTFALRDHDHLAGLDLAYEICPDDIEGASL